MTKDYKPSTSKAKAKNASGKKNGLVIFVVGLLMGFVVGMWLGWENHRNGLTHDAKIQQRIRELEQQLALSQTLLAEKAEDIQKAAMDVEAAIDDGGEQLAAPEFDFYHILPEAEVELPNTATEETLAEQTESPSAKEQYQYGLQVASFRHYKDAERLKAKLALVGLQASINISTSSKSKWYRVRLGPFSSLREMDRMQRQLHKHGFDSMRFRSTAAG